MGKFETGPLYDSTRQLRKTFEARLHKQLPLSGCTTRPDNCVRHLKHFVRTAYDKGMAVRLDHTTAYDKVVQVYTTRTAYDKGMSARLGQLRTTFFQCKQLNIL